MALGQITAKVVLTIINLVFCVMAVILMMVGAWLFSEYIQYDRVAGDNSVLIPSAIVLAVGFVLLLIGFLGFFVTFKAHKCLTGLYTFVLVVMFVGLIIAAVLAYVYRKEIDKSLHEGMQVALNDYVSNRYIQMDVDFMQSELRCCGVDNYTDWLNTAWYQNQSDPNIKYPTTCCEQKNCTYVDPDSRLYKEGCYQKLKHEFCSNFVVIASVAIVCTVILLLGLLCASFLLYRRQQDAGYIGLPESDGLQV